MFDKVEKAIAEIAAGRLVVVVDDEGRENEGDLVCAAQFATTENINFMATFAKGLVCMPMSGEDCDRLGLPQMVERNTDNHETAFTVSIDHVSTTTGMVGQKRPAISAWYHGFPELAVMIESSRSETPFSRA